MCFLYSFANVRKEQFFRLLGTLVQYFGPSISIFVLPNLDLVLFEK